ncbi:hypothetical protein ARMGADRAFT_1077719 [Armillaria gallica]|uniref:Uncharacterized protein n=1 Tax=Armillaria gallica TaxID=47427 RepID=A0A2H3DQR7_ARMGA|nr:hypothetical protein ARMGADRAFT_1077719 [Armillaria gallica]
MGSAPSHLGFGEGASVAGGTAVNPSEIACSSGEASGCQVRKRMLFEHNVTECNSTLVIALVSLGILLLMAVLVYRRRRCRKLTDIESKAFHAAIMLPVEDRKNVEKQTMIIVVEDKAPLA